VVSPALTSARAERILFLALLGIAALPALLFEYFPSQDGPAHLANATVIADSSVPIFAAYLDVGTGQGTNVLADLGLAALISFLAPSLAEKVMAVLLLAGLPVAARFCLRQLDPGSTWLAILTIPLGAGLFVYYGFFNFLLGVVLSLIAFGYWLRRLRGGRARAVDWIVFAGLTAAVFISHPMPLLALLLLIGASIVGDVARTADGGGSVPRFLRRFAPVIAIAGVPLAMLVVFASSRSTDIRFYGSPFGRAARFWHAPVMALSNWEIPFAVLPALAIVMLGVVIVRRGGRPGPSSSGYVIAVGTLAVVYIAGPQEIGEGSVIPPRVALYLMLTVVFWITTMATPRRARVAAVTLAAIAVVGLTAVRIPVHADLSRDTSEYVSGLAVVAPQSTVLPIWGSEPGKGLGGRVAPSHLSGYLMASAEVVDLDHFLGVLSISPVQLRAEYRLAELLPRTNRDALILGPELVDVAGYARAGPGRVDYIWMWDRSGADPTVTTTPAVA
jgi:hypothetical protein